jgi:hypothetical protein
MPEPLRYRTLVETDECAAQFDAILARYSSAVIGPVLEGLLWGIATNPKGYDQTTWNVRIAKSSHELGLTIPAFRIFFQVQNEGTNDESVLLLWIEEMISTDEMGYLT